MNKLRQSNELLQKLYLVITISFIAIIFLIDLVTPLGITIGIFYFFPLFLAVFLLDNNRIQLSLGLVCSILIMVVLLLVEPNLEYKEAIANRVLSVVFNILAAAIAMRYKKSLSKNSLLELKMAAAIERAPNGFLMIESNGAITFANKEIERIFGYNQNELIGKNVDFLVPGQYKGDHGKHRDNYLKAPKTRSMGGGRVLYGLRKDGSEVPIEIGLNPFKVENTVFVMSSIVDITERKKHEDTLAEANQERERIIEKLKRSNQELDDFAYIASHDLKEPLRGLFNNSKFLQEDYSSKLDEAGVTRLKRLGHLCQRMENLVNDLLYFSRLGRQELAIQETNLKEIIKEIQVMMETTLQEKNAVIKVAENLPNIVCDRPRITEVFRNLITNAVKYNNKEQKIIEVGWLEAKEVFYVKDNGIGIEKEFYEEIFRIFKRLNEEDDDKKGTGVGLTFVRKIIERHGGRIWVESQIGEGSAFYFTVKQGDLNERQRSEVAVHTAG